MALDYSMERLENDRNDLLHQMERYKFDIPINVTIKVEEEEKDYCQENFGNPLNELEKQIESYSKNYFDKPNTPSSKYFKNCMSDQVTSTDLLRSTSSNFNNIFDEKIKPNAENNFDRINMSNSECLKKCTLDDVTSKNLLPSTSSNCVNNEPVSNTINYSNKINNESNNECLKDLMLDGVASSNCVQSTPSNVNTISEKDNKFTPDKDLAMNKIQLVTFLDRLSENLIELSKYSYEANIRYKHKVVSYKTAKEKYLSTKNIFFHLSYRTITAIILPQENNQTFIHKLVKRTIAIAHTKSWYCISEKLILCYLKEMIHWVKQRNKILESRSNGFGFSIVQDTRESLSGMPTNIICIENTNNKKTKKKTQKSRTFTNKTKSNFKFANSAPKRRKTTESIFPTRSTTKNLNMRRHSLQNSNLTDNLPNDKQTRDVMLNTNNSYPVSNMSRYSGSGNSTYNLQPTTELLSSYRNCGERNIEEKNNATTFHNTISSNKNSLLVRPCCVCQTLTHKMCVGCYKLYYCSLTCQSMDWAVHKNTCGRVV